LRDERRTRIILVFGGLTARSQRFDDYKGGSTLRLSKDPRLYFTRISLFSWPRKKILDTLTSTFALTSVRDINRAMVFFFFITLVHPRRSLPAHFRAGSARFSLPLGPSRGSSCSHHYSQTGYFAVFVLRRDVITIVRGRSWL